MPIQVTCQCGRSFRAKASDAGKRAKCPACGVHFRIPQQEAKLVASGSVYGTIKPKYCLTVTKGPQKVHEHFRLRRARLTTIGKASDNTVVLPSPMVSRHHCQLSWTKRGWLLEDLKSTNGTRVNDNKIDAGVILDGGERIKLGDFALIFKLPKGEGVQPARIDEQLQALQSGDPQAGQAAIEFLAACGVQAADHLVPKLSGFDTIAGHLALDVLEKIGPDAVPALVRALKDKDTLVRGSAARALGRLGSNAASAVLDLLEALDDQNPTVYAEVAWALGQIGAAAVPGLLKALGSGQRVKQLSAAWTLGRIGPDAAAALPHLSELARNDDREVSQVAKAALKKISPTEISA